MAKQDPPGSAVSTSSDNTSPPPRAQSTGAGTDEWVRGPGTCAAGAVGAMAHCDLRARGSILWLFLSLSLSRSLSVAVPTDRFLHIAGWTDSLLDRFAEHNVFCGRRRTHRRGALAARTG